jgi:hypothetical protein
MMNNKNWLLRGITGASSLMQEPADHPVMVNPADIRLPGILSRKQTQSAV